MTFLLSSRPNGLSVGFGFPRTLAEGQVGQEGLKGSESPQTMTGCEQCVWEGGTHLDSAPGPPQGQLVPLVVPGLCWEAADWPRGPEEPLGPLFPS